MSARERDPEGSALIIVLLSLSLLMILVVGFLASVGTELNASKIYANDSSIRILTQSTVNLAIGQIRVATGDASLCWASQPGMIRTYDSTGRATAFYKLFSGDQMQGSGSYDSELSNHKIPLDWFDQKGNFVDLNQPLRVGVSNFYPIVHGEPNDYKDYAPAFDAGTGTGQAKVLIASSGNSGDPSDVTGFWLRKDTPIDSSSPNLAPMPVKWLYVLKNGAMIAADNGAIDGRITFLNAGSQPSDDNPLVGRIAFWTDDDTSKVNINTASEGFFWDTPRTYTVQDRAFALRQPVQGEFQRYPGHPATVSLSAIFGLSNSRNIWSPAAPFSQEDLYAITPATKAGGSQGGTAVTTPTSSILPPSVTRLYTTVDELVFQTSLSSGDRNQNASLLSQPSALSSQVLRKSRFFLTSASQAPDVNVFNLPRVSMWPITLNRTTGAAATTPYDKLISHCATVNKHIFYFQRQDPTSPTHDLPENGSDNGLGRNRQLLDYLRGLTEQPIPGFSSGSFAAKYGDDDRHQILTELFDYVRATNLQDSSTGATIYAQSLDNTPTSPTYLGGLGQVVPIVDTQINIPDPSGGLPIHPRGFGRYPTVQQAAIAFIGVDDNRQNPAPPALPIFKPSFDNWDSATQTYTVPGFGTYNKIAASSNNTRVQAAFFLQMFDPSQGVAITYPWYEMEVDGLNSLEWSNTQTDSYPMGLPALGVIAKPYTKSIGATGQILFGGQNDFRSLTYRREALAGAKYPFVAAPTGGSSGCPDMNTQIFFKGGSATVKIFALDNNGARIGSEPVQTIALSFPSATIPVPEVIADSTAQISTSYSTVNLRSFYDGASSGRLNMGNVPCIGKKDRTRALIATPGDMRLVAPRLKVDSTSLQPIGPDAPLSNYYSSTVTHSHMLRFGLTFPMYGGMGGKLVDINYSNYKSYYDVWVAPDRYVNDISNLAATGSFYRSKDVAVPGLTGVAAPGGADWDTGIANSPDGSFINKADEGDAGGKDSAGVPYDPYFGLDYDQALPGPTFFSPNRMIPSPGMFGSLPTGVFANRPWQTLLFRPASSGHRGLGVGEDVYPSAPPYSSPPDHLILDLFTMPVVEPYAISTPLATSGRINMNYQIVPFTYIHRDTGLRAAMKAQMLTAISKPSPSYKTYQNPSRGTNPPANLTVRFPINADATLSQFQLRFNSADIFRSASEICSIDLVPQEPAAPTIPITRAKMEAYWNNPTTGKIVTGDNVKERPYTNIYPLLTTKSNTYTVHYRVQTLRQTPRGDKSFWKEGVDQVTGQSRGSQTIERYVDPNDQIPDYATEANSTPLSAFYKYRTVAARRFAP